MQTQDYTKITISDFNGLFKRGMADECPQDHAICSQNNIYPKKDEVSSRNGIGRSLTTTWPIKKSFVPTNSAAIPGILTLDFNGVIRFGNNATPAYTLAGMSDFAALNLYNKTFILPIGTASGKLQVWPGPGKAIRDACGARPASGVTAADGAAGGVDPGVHKFVVAYETDTGFITPPSNTVTSYTAPGAKKVDISSIPTGPAYVVARHILVTRGNEEEYFFVNGGRIGDNTSTTVTLDFFDSDLVISADYLFDLLESVPASQFAAQLFEFHGRMLTTGEGNLVRVSRPGDAESFNNVDGFIQIPEKHDGGHAGAMCQLRDTLYIMKGVGIFSTQDNGDIPSSWHVTQIDGTAGTYPNSLSTVTGAESALPTNEFFTLATRTGIYVFTGTVDVRPLTWKIDDIWQTLTHGWEQNIFICMDPFKQLLFCALPTNGSQIPNLLIVGDYSDGLDWKAIKWDLWFFPFIPCHVWMSGILDDDGAGDFDYYLRISSQSQNGLFKMTPRFTDDLGTPIESVYTTALFPVEKGTLGIFRGVRMRVRGTGNLQRTLYPEDMQNPVTIPNLALEALPGREFLQQINFTGEKMAFSFGVSELGASYTVNRVDIFGKKQFMARPA